MMKVGAGILLLVSLILGIYLFAPSTGVKNEERQWLAGDGHVHSHYSVGWDEAVSPPAPIKGGDAIYPIPHNVAMARKFGLSWMVTTDHGGPNHSKVNFEQAYPELLHARDQYPDMVIFYGMEFDTPGADHSGLIMPQTTDEAERLRAIESQYSRREPYPRDKSWDTEERMIEALEMMRDMEPAPAIIAHHPSRSAADDGVYGRTDPAELRDWNDTAPNVAVGMEGAPGHQAATLTLTFAPDPNAYRGGYRNHPTYGGFDQMTAIVGGMWDSFLGEGRRWWITANSDSHVHYTEGGSDFWPGEYSKTYVHAASNSEGVLEALRAGRSFVTTGDLVSAVDVELKDLVTGDTATLGEELRVSKGAEVELSVTVTDPDGLNYHGESVEVRRIDLITGLVTGPSPDRDLNTNSSAAVAARFETAEWVQRGEEIRIKRRFLVHEDMYLRLRGTNTDELEPKADPKEEDPWSDLWFYTNPVFISVSD